MSPRTAQNARSGVSERAVQLLADADVIDLHLDVDVPARVYGYRSDVRHPRATVARRFFGHTDFPRLREASFNGVVYDIATNPFRPAANRLRVTLQNITDAKSRIALGGATYCRSARDYVLARKQGKIGCWLSLQGGNALEHDPSVLETALGRDLHRITLVHLTHSTLGGTSSPIGRDRGLTPHGRAFIARCHEQRILVDLAHAGKSTFWQALDALPTDTPPIVSHTGVAGVHPHWRNIDDAQIVALADRGGVVGILYHSAFLGPVGVFGRVARSKILEHIEHVIRIGGEHTAAIGTDYDGAIIPPHDLPDITDHPILIQDMLDRGWSEIRIRNVLGLNYLRVATQVRPE